MLIVDGPFGRPVVLYGVCSTRVFRSLRIGQLGMLNGNKLTLTLFQPEEARGCRLVAISFRVSSIISRRLRPAPNLHRATIAQQRVRIEAWRQERLGSKQELTGRKDLSGGVE